MSVVRFRPEAPSLIFVKVSHFAGVAQLAEQLICNQQVAGSIPIVSSIFRSAIKTSSKFPGPLVRVAGEGHAPSSGCGKKQKAFCIAWWGSRAAKGNRL